MNPEGVHVYLAVACGVFIVSLCAVLFPTRCFLPSFASDPIYMVYTSIKIRKIKFIAYIRLNENIDEKF